jgi:ribosomal protein S18 acetylase RimI-like enzyme
MSRQPGPVTGRHVSSVPGFDVETVNSRARIRPNSIVSVTIEELPEYLVADAVALWHEAGLTRPWNDPYADLQRARSGATSTVLAALGPGGALRGTVMVGHDGHRGWVYYLAVQPDHRGQGLGRNLMEASENWLRRRDVPKLNLMVRHSNHAATAFYEALGYEDGEVVVLGRFLDK